MECGNCLYYDKCGDLPYLGNGCKDYADKGLYLKFPCKLGSTVYLSRYNSYDKRWQIEKGTVVAYSITRGGIRMEYKTFKGFYEVSAGSVGKGLFTTEKEALDYIRSKGGNKENE